MKKNHALTLCLAGLLATPFALLADASKDIVTPLSDTAITATVKSKLAADPVTHATNIHVETVDGTVTLSGTALSETEATQAVTLAESTDNVKKVKASDLKVANSEHPLKDSIITAEFKGLLIKNNLTPGEKILPFKDIKAETQRGVLYLRGTVDNVEQKNKLIKLAHSLEDVTEVKSTLKMRKQ